jgi:hypothetical protein
MDGSGFVLNELWASVGRRRPVSEHPAVTLKTDEEA